MMTNLLPPQFSHPARLLSLAIGIVLLLMGSVIVQAPDWDFGVCFVMAVFTYLTAEKSVAAFLDRRWPDIPMAIFWTWFSVDGVYVVYHVSVGNQMLREGQWSTSLCLYLICGLIWRVLPDVYTKTPVWLRKTLTITGLLFVFLSGLALMAGRVQHIRYEQCMATLPAGKSSSYCID